MGCSQEILIRAMARLFSCIAMQFCSCAVHAAAVHAAAVHAAAAHTAAAHAAAAHAAIHASGLKRVSTDIRIEVSELECKKTSLAHVLAHGVH